MSEQADKPVFCANCGERNPRTNKFCGSCGTPIVLPPSPPQPSPPSPPPPSPPAPLPTSPRASEPLGERGDRGERITPRPMGREERATSGEGPGVRAELDRLLTRANVERARALVRDARKTLAEALALAEGLPPSAAAPVYEQLGDLLAAEERWEQAKEHYEKALNLFEQKRPAVEKKLGEVMVRLSDQEALQRLGALAPSEDLIDVLKQPEVGRRNAGAAMLFSVVPGLGQLYCGQFIKAGVIFGSFALAMVVILLSPDRADLMEQLSATLTLRVTKAPAPGPLTVVAGVVLLLTWLWSIADAPFSAGRTEEKVLPNLTPAPMGNRSDWEP